MGKKVAHSAYLRDVLKCVSTSLSLIPTSMFLEWEFLSECGSLFTFLTRV